MCGVIRQVTPQLYYITKYLQLILLSKVDLIKLYINKLYKHKQLLYYMLNLHIEVLPMRRTRKLGHDLRLKFMRFVKVITSPD